MPLQWKIEKTVIPFEQALSQMETHVQLMIEKKEDERVWLLEHPPIYTGGTSAKSTDLLKKKFPVYQTGRGGQYTYHGPGQRIAYVMLDLKKRNPDIRAYIQLLEEWLIQTLALFDVIGERRKDRIGIWVDLSKYGISGKEAKIAAIGVRLRKWITFHGVSLNVNPDLSHFDGIVPCGLQNYGVTSFKDLGLDIPMAEVDSALRRTWKNVFEH